MGKKRVLIFLPCFTHGGAERQGALLARYLRDEGNEVEAWGFPSLANEAPLAEILDGWGIPRVELPAWPRFRWGLGRLWWRSQLDAFARTLPKRRFDVVIPFTPWPCIVSALLGGSLGAGTVVWNHRGGLHPGGIRFSPFLVEAILSRAPRFVANSNIGAEFLRRTFSLRPPEIQVIRNAFVPDVGDDDGKLRPVDPASPRPLELLHLANMFGEKDGETLLDAASRLQSMAIRFHLHLAGHFPNPRRRRQLESRASKLRLGERVTFHGAIDRRQVSERLWRADVGLLSSMSEGMPNSVMEYMYCRLPVVGTDIPGIRELVPESHADWLFPVGDAARFADLIARLARDPQLRAGLGHANRRRVEEHFAAERILPQWKRLIEGP